MTAEFAVVLPAVVLVLAACLSASQVAGLQIRLQDAAATAARQLARGDLAAARSIAARLVPGSAVSSSERDGVTCATVSAHPPGLLAGVRVAATACALRTGS